MIAKIGHVDSQIPVIVLRAIIKKEGNKKINASKIYSPPGRHMEWAKK